MGACIWGFRACLAVPTLRLKDSPATAGKDETFSLQLGDYSANRLLGCPPALRQRPHGGQLIARLELGHKLAERAVNALARKLGGSHGAIFPLYDLSRLL